MSLDKPITGVIGAALTPFSDRGGIDFDALAKEIDFLVEELDAISIGAVEAAEYTMLAASEGSSCCGAVHTRWPDASRSSWASPTHRPPRR